MTTTTISRGQTASADISSLIRARNPLIWISSREEGRVEGYLVKAAKAAGYDILFWDIAQGVTTLDGKPHKSFRDAQDPTTAFTFIRAEAERTLNPTEKSNRTVWVFRDLPAWLEGQPGAVPRRHLRNFAKSLPRAARKTAQCIIILTPDATLPPDLAGNATVVEFPLPDRIEIEEVLNSAVNSLPEFKNGKDGKPDTTQPLRVNAVTDDTRDHCIDAAVGLTADEAASCYAKSVVMCNRIDPVIVSAEKKRVISKSGVLEWIEPVKGGLDAVGGLENVKTWLEERKNARGTAARAYGLPAPKGIVLTGIPGCGKSLSAKCVPTAWEVPLLRLDLGALKDKFVGGSEGNLRKALKVVEAMGACIVWIDEIEKAMQGATSGSADGGVSADALGTILNWMQERTNEAFVIATANDVTSLPPELLRKGRFDEVFFVDLPNDEERKSVLKAALKANGRADIKIDLDAVSAASPSFTGSEIAELVPTALYAAFANKGREITTQDLLNAAVKVVPLARTAEARIKAIREWGAQNARPATLSVADVNNATDGIEVDLD